MKKNSTNKKFNSYLMLVGFALILVLFIFQQNAALGKLEESIDHQDLQVKNIIQDYRNNLYEAEELVTLYEFEKIKDRINKKNTIENELTLRPTAIKQFETEQSSDLKLGNANLNIQISQKSYSKNKPYRPDIPLIISEPRSKIQNISMHKAHISPYYKTSQSSEQILSTEAQVQTDLEPSAPGYYQ